MANSDIALFFRDPHSAPVTPGNFSQLYVLRRDIYICFGIDPNTGNLNVGWPQTIFPGVMAILAGVDLLGKFFAGNDTSSQVGHRFKNFLIRYFGLSVNDAETLYQLRNSLMHSFGLYSATRAGIVCQFTLSHGNQQLISSTRPHNFNVDVDQLHRWFETAVAAYLSDLQTIGNPDQVDLENKFLIMIRKHRLIGIG